MRNKSCILKCSISLYFFIFSFYNFFFYFNFRKWTILFPFFERLASSSVRENTLARKITTNIFFFIFWDIFIYFYILIMHEKVLVSCEKWLSKISSNLYVLRPPESEKGILRKCLSVCLSDVSRILVTSIELSDWIELWHTLSEPKK